MGDDLERLSRLIDDLAAERSPGERHALPAEEASLAQTAAFLKADSGRAVPDEHFVSRLGERLAAQRGATPSSAPRPGDALAGPGESPAMPAASEPHPVPSASPPAAEGLTRRGLLRRLGVAAGMAAGVGAGALVRGQTDSAAAAAAYERGKREGYADEARAPYAAPLAPRDRGAWFDTGHTAAGLPAGSALRFRAGAVEGFLVNPGAGRPIYALSAGCTHMGCLVSWLQEAGTFLCPCHGAQYGADGGVLSGIARHPLPRLEVRVERDGGLYVWSVAEQPAVTTVAPYERP